MQKKKQPLKRVPFELRHSHSLNNNSWSQLSTNPDWTCFWYCNYNPFNLYLPSPISHPQFSFVQNLIPYSSPPDSKTPLPTPPQLSLSLSAMANVILSTRAPRLEPDRSTPPWSRSIHTDTPPGAYADPHPLPWIDLFVLYSKYLSGQHPIKFNEEFGNLR